MAGLPLFTLVMILYIFSTCNGFFEWCIFTWRGSPSRCFFKKENESSPPTSSKDYFLLNYNFAYRTIPKKHNEIGVEETKHVVSSWIRWHITGDMFDHIPMVVHFRSYISGYYSRHDPSIAMFVKNFRNNVHSGDMGELEEHFLYKVKLSCCCCQFLPPIKSMC